MTPVARPGPDVTRTILVPIDGSDPAEAALEFALDQFEDAHVVVYHAINPLAVGHGDAELTKRDFWPGQLEAAKAESETVLDSARTRAEEADVEVEFEAQVGLPTDAIVEYAEAEDVDHVVVGSRGRSGLERIALGSVAEKVVRRCSAPVTLVHGEESSGPGVQ